MTTPQALSDDDLWSLWNAQGTDEMNKDEALAFARQAISATLAALGGQDPVYWEWRHLGTHPDAVDFGQWSEWKQVKGSGPLHTAEDRLDDLRAYIADGYKYELRALYTLPPAQPSPALHTDGWLQSGGLLYRLTDERRPQNRDEINVTMADGSRSEASRTRRAGELLDRIRGAQPAPAPVDERTPITEFQRGTLLIEYMGPDALAGRQMSLMEAFDLGIEAAERHHKIIGEEARAALQAPAPQTKG